MTEAHFKKLFSCITLISNLKLGSLVKNNGQARALFSFQVNDVGAAILEEINQSNLTRWTDAQDRTNEEKWHIAFDSWDLKSGTIASPFSVDDLPVRSFPDDHNVEQTLPFAIDNLTVEDVHSLTGENVQRNEKVNTIKDSSNPFEEPTEINNNLVVDVMNENICKIEGSANPLKEEVRCDNNLPIDIVNEKLKSFEENVTEKDFSGNDAMLVDPTAVEEQKPNDLTELEMGVLETSRNCDDAKNTNRTTEPLLDVNSLSSGEDFQRIAKESDFNINENADILKRNYITATEFTFDFGKDANSKTLHLPGDNNDNLGYNCVFENTPKFVISSEAGLVNTVSDVRNADEEIQHSNIDEDEKVTHKNILTEQLDLQDTKTKHSLTDNDENLYLKKAPDSFDKPTTRTSNPLDINNQIDARRIYTNGKDDICDKRLPLEESRGFVSLGKTISWMVSLCEITQASSDDLRKRPDLVNKLLMYNIRCMFTMLICLS